MIAIDAVAAVVAMVAAVAIVAMAAVLAVPAVLAVLEVLACCQGWSRASCAVFRVFCDSSLLILFACTPPLPLAVPR